MFDRTITSIQVTGDESGDFILLSTLIPRLTSDAANEFFG